jgi:hypothetical protein
MLRVITMQLADDYRLELHGVLGGEWVRLLEQHWRALVAAAPSAAITLALADVEFIDADGEALLRRMAAGGVVFVVSGCLNRYVIERLQANVAATTE